MHLEDGRLLIPAKRYNELLQVGKKTKLCAKQNVDSFFKCMLQNYTVEELEKWKLVKVDENFRVIAIGLPVPRYYFNLQCL